MTLYQEDVRRLHAACTQVGEIDQTVRRMSEKLENTDAMLGHETRLIIGRNLLTQFTDSDLGSIIFCAIENALLDRRERIVAAHGDMVTFPDPPCPRQTFNPDCEESA